MLRLFPTAFAFLLLAVSLPAPVQAQGQGGYARGCPGAETARMTVDERARARAARQTNDTNGGRSSIDKSCKTWEGGGTIAGPQPGAIDWRREADQRPDLSRGLGGAHTRF
jgi:hypothetical protein